MAEGDIIRVQATESAALAQKIVDQLTADLAAAQAAGDEIAVANIKAKQAAVKGPAAAAMQAPETVQATTTALTEQEAIAGRLLATEQETLAVLRSQYETRLQLAAPFLAGGRTAQSAAMLPAAPVPVGAPPPGEYAAALGGAAEQQAAARAATAQAEAAASARQVAEAEAAAAAEAQAVARAEQEQEAANAAILAQLQKEAQLRSLVLAATQNQAKAVGMVAGAQATPITPAQRQAIVSGPVGPGAAAIGGQFSAAEQQMVRYNLAVGESAGLASRAELSEAGMAGSLTRVGAASNQASLALRQHGALTTEFLSALQRGETTIQEFGYQIGATVGKFAGWTAAATATYGLLGAIVEMGSGAVHAATGVTMLTRTINNVNPDQAAGAIRKLSADTNVSIKEAADTMFMFSRTFHNVNDAALASREALSLYKLDGVSLNDTMKLSTAIHQQFGLSMQQMVPYFDEMAQGQREFNARTTDMVPALQKSMAVVKNAGGNLQDYIQIVTYAIRTTQLTGSQIGTAFSRGIANFLNPQTSKGKADRAVLASFGIDPNQPITQVIFDALKKAPALSPQQRQQLSMAMFGPLRGGLMAGLFQADPSLLKDLQKGMSPEASKGALGKELEKQLHAAGEELKSLLNGLQRIGSVIASSGLLSPFKLFLDMLVGIEHAIGSIVGAFGKIPEPFRKWLSTLIEIRVAMLALTRTQFGQSVGQLPGVRSLTTLVPGARANQQDIFRQQAIVGTRATEMAIAKDAGQTGAKLETSNAGVARMEQEAARLKASVAAFDEQLAGVASGLGAANITEIDAAKLTDEQVALLAKRNAAEEEANAASQRLSAAKAEQLGLEQRLTDQQAAQARQARQRVALQKNTMAPAELAALQAQMTAGTVGVEGEARQVGLGEAIQARFAAAQGKLSAAMGKLTGSTTAAGAASAATGAETAVNTSVTQKAAAEVSLTSAAMTSAATIGADFKGILGKMGGLFNVWTVGLIGLPMLFQAWQDNEKQLSTALKNVNDSLDQVISGATTDLKTVISSLNEKTRAKAREAQGYNIPLIGPIVGPATVGVQEILGRDPNRSSSLAGSGGARSQDQAKTITAVQNSINARLHDLSQMSQTLSGSTGDQAKMYAALNDLKTSGMAPLSTLGLDPKQVKALRQWIATQAQNLYNNYQAMAAQDPKGLGQGADPFAPLRGLKPKDIEATIQMYADKVKVYGPDPEILRKMTTAYAFLAGKFAGSNVSADLQAVDSARSQLIGAVRESAQMLMDQAAATNDKKLKISLDNQAKTEVAAVERKLRDSEAILQAQANAARATAAHAKATYQAAKNTLAAEKAAMDAGKATVGQVITWTYTMAAVQAAIDKNYAEMQKALGDAAGAQKTLDAAKAADATVFSQLDAVLASANKGIASASKVPKQRQTPASQDPMELTRLQRELEQAQAWADPVKVAQIGQELARQEISAARNAHERLQAQIDLAKANQEYDKAIQDQAQAKMAYAASLTQDPVKQAVWAVREAAQKVSFDAAHGGLDTTQAYTDRAALNNARASLVSAHVQAREDTIKFQLDMGRITYEQAIQEYQGILNVHGITTQLRRNVLEAIQQLKQQGQSQFGDLALGTIRLPTPYEIRRSFQAAQQGTQVNSTYNTTIQVNDTASANRVGVVMDNYHRGTAKSVARATGRR